MARRVKDLFAVLAERQGERERPREVQSPNRKPNPGESIGRWFRNTVKSLRPQAEATPAPAPSRRRRSTPPVTVDSGGLSMPGWLLAAMLVAALGCGFLVGRFVRPNADTERLAAKKSGVAEKPSVFRGPGAAGFLDAAAETAEVHKLYFVVKVFPPKERAAASELAQGLRARGLHTTRIKPLYKDGSLFCWATLCYVPSFAEEKPTLQALRAQESALGFTADPVLCQL